MTDRETAYNQERARRKRLRDESDLHLQAVEECKRLRDWLLAPPTHQHLEVLSWQCLNGERREARIPMTSWRGAVNEPLTLRMRGCILEYLNFQEDFYKLPLTRQDELPDWPDGPPPEVLMA